MLALAIGLPLLASCGTPPPSSLSTVVHRSATLLTHAASIHMEFATEASPPSSVIAAESGSGTYVAPSTFSGSFIVGFHGVPLSVDIVVTGSSTYLRAPLAQGFSKGDPSAYGFPNPVAFFSHTAGFPALLQDTTSLHYAGLTSQSGTLEWSITGTVPNAMLAGILKTPHVTRTDAVTYVIDPHTGMLTSLTVRAPLYTASMLTSVTISLAYPASPPHITPPPS